MLQDTGTEGLWINCCTIERYRVYKLSDLVLNFRFHGKCAHDRTSAIVNSYTPIPIRLPVADDW